MAAVARDGSLALSELELVARCAAGEVGAAGVYPFHPSGVGPADGGSEVKTVIWGS
jgi:hypothetical protein